VIAHGLGAERQSLCDLGVVVALRDQVEDFALAIGEFREDLGGRRRGTALDLPIGGDVAEVQLACVPSVSP